MNSFLLKMSEFRPFRGDLDYKLIRAVMVFTFFAFGIQKWNAYTATILVPLISHSPVVFWLEPVFGVRGAGYFLGTSELTFGTLILLGHWSHKLGVLGALGSLVTFVGTTSIIFFLPNEWAKEAGGFPIMTLPLGFLIKDFLFLAASFYLLKRDLIGAAAEFRPFASSGTQTRSWQLDFVVIFRWRLGPHSGPRSRARAWARQLHEAYPEIQGFQYGSSMNGHAPAIVLNERARGALPKEPQFHRALNDDMLVDVLQRIALRLSYGLR